MLGAPDGIFEELLESGVDITFLYEPRTVAERIGVRRRVLVSVVRGTIDEDGHRQDDRRRRRRRRRSSIDGESALLLTGAPHMMVLFRRRTAASTRSTRGSPARRSCGSASALLIRVEGELSRARLIAIARSVALS